MSLHFRGLSIFIALTKCSRELSGGFASLLNEYRITKTHSYISTECLYIYWIYCYILFKNSGWHWKGIMCIMLDSCRLIFERSHFERSENEFFRSRFSDLLELNSCAKLQNWLLGSIEPSFLLCRDLKTRFYRTQKPDLTWMGSVQI